MDKLYEQTMLFDFYGELLTEHQRSVYIDAVYNDLSLGEIAEERGISRQGVHDLIRRCDKIMKEYESRLHLVERFSRAKKTVREIQELSGVKAGVVPGGQAGCKADDAGAGSSETDSAEADSPEDGQRAAEDLQSRLRRIGELSQELLEEL